MLKNALTTSVRFLSKNRIYTLINVLGLALGLSTSILIFIYVSDELSFDKFHEDYENIYRVQEYYKWTDYEQSWATCDGSMAVKIKEFSDETTHVCRLMSYFNPIHKLGLENIVKIAKQTDVDGFIIPDLLPFETEDEISFDKILLQNNMYQILLASIISGKNRMEKILENSNGFLYLISKVGTTGESSNLNFEAIKNTVDFIKQTRDIPIAVGFGVSNREQIKNLKPVADAIIVGSALVKMIRDTKDIKKIKNFVIDLKQELRA